MNRERIPSVENFRALASQDIVKLSSEPPSKTTRPMASRWFDNVKDPRWNTAGPERVVAEWIKSTGEKQIYLA